MRNIVVSLDLTLDGVMESPEQWAFSYRSPDMAEVIQAQMRASDAMLFGRVTYEAFAAYWPFQSSDEMGFADKLNNTPKFVVSKTLDKAQWNNSTLIKEHVADELTKLKQQPGGDIVIIGSATLIQSLMDDDLIDQYRLFVYPVILGSGKRLFHNGIGQKKLKLVATAPFSSGVVLLTYQAAPRV